MWVNEGKKGKQFSHQRFGICRAPHNGVPSNGNIRPDGRATEKEYRKRNEAPRKEKKGFEKQRDGNRARQRQYRVFPFALLAFRATGILAETPQLFISVPRCASHRFVSCAVEMVRQTPSTGTFEARRGVNPLSRKRALFEIPSARFSLSFVRILENYSSFDRDSTVFYRVNVLLALTRFNQRRKESVSKSEYQRARAQFSLTICINLIIPREGGDDTWI